MPRGQGRRTVGLGAQGKGLRWARGWGSGLELNRAAERSAWPRLAAAWPPLELVRGLDVSTLAMTTSRSGGTDFGVGLGQRVRVSGSG